MDNPRQSANRVLIDPVTSQEMNQANGTHSSSLVEEPVNNHEKVWARLFKVSIQCGAVNVYNLSKDRCVMGSLGVSGTMFLKADEDGLPIVCKDFSGAISRRHLEITKLNAHSFSIKDLGSANGTLVNGVRISCQELK